LGYFIVFRGAFNMADDDVAQVEAVSQVSQDGQVEVLLKDEGVVMVYANFARVVSTPEELIVDFGVNSNPFGNGQQEVRVSTKVVLGLYTAKRLLAALQMTIAQHEGVFGVLELDVRKRVQVSADVQDAPLMSTPAF
jgi:uncharacterized protein VirK/YbjX